MPGRKAKIGVRYKSNPGWKTLSHPAWLVDAIGLYIGNHPELLMKATWEAVHEALRHWEHYDRMILEYREYLKNVEGGEKA